MNASTLLRNGEGGGGGGGGGGGAAAAKAARSAGFAGGAAVSDLESGEADEGADGQVRGYVRSEEDVGRIGVAVVDESGRVVGKLRVGRLYE